MDIHIDEMNTNTIARQIREIYAPTVCWWMEREKNTLVYVWWTYNGICYGYKNK